MRRSRSPVSSYCTASGKDSSDWDVWAFRVKPRLRSGMSCLGLEFSMAQTGRLLLVTAMCTRAHLPSLAISRREAFVPTLFAYPVQQPVALRPSYAALADAATPRA